ncbi:MAG: hypothetical protein V3571_02080 [Pseudodesulfovibrio sp.]
MLSSELNFVQMLKQGGAVLSKGVFAPIIILALWVISAATIIVTKSSDDFAKKSALVAAGAMILFVCVCYACVLIFKEDLFRSDDYAKAKLAYKGKGEKVLTVTQKAAQKRKPEAKQSTKGKSK